jgi:hypothetical protein
VRLPGLPALQGILQPPTRPLVEREHLRPVLQRDLLDNLHHGVQVLKDVERKPVIPPGHEALRTAAILGRARAVASSAGGIGLPSLRFQPALDADLVAPGDVQVVLVDEPRALAKAQRRQRHVRRRCRHLPRAIARGAEMKVVEVDALPAHRHLDHAVQLTQGEARWHQNPTPDHRADPGQPDFYPRDRFGVRGGRRGILFRKRLPRPPFHRARLPRQRGTPNIVMLS